MITFPYTWSEDDNDLVIRKFGEGWILKNEHCDYHMRFRPDSLEPVFRLEAGPKYSGLMNGYCENFDGDKSNDEDED